jgi:hypothetical protein
MSNYEMRVTSEVIAIALERVEGFPFERFACDFLASLDGRDFVPMGGVGDGGADALISSELYKTTKTDLFYQFTIQKDHRSKIRQTISRLIEFGRVPKTLYYVTSRQIQHIDKEEELLTEELGVIVKIRDKTYIMSHVNSSIGTINAYRNHLERYTDFLSKIGKEPSANTQHVDDPSVYVFLQHEVSNRLGDRKLVHSICDTLILWSLSDTDPEKGVFLKRTDIRNLISVNFPWANSFLNAHLDNRLEALRTKDAQGRELRWYKKEDKFCLPYDTREIIKSENVEDVALRIQCSEELRLRASELFDGDDGEYELLATLTLAVVQKIFERQGLLLSHFISDDNENDEVPFVAADCIEEIVESSDVNAENSSAYKHVISQMLNTLFYDSTPTQRTYLHYLSRTYILLFTLKAEPRIIDYFSGMGANFRLFVGTDILVRALSERFVKEEDQRCRNVLKACASIGMKLCLSSAVLDEVHAHLKSTHRTFISHVAPVEQYLSRDIVRNSSKILIRAYFYAKERGSVRSWKSFIEQFVSFENLPSDKGREEIKKYLVSEYNLVFYKNSELESLVNSELVEDLASTLLEKGEKENEHLATNSALLVHGIYGLRDRDNESSNGSPFGYKTWWLTNQKRITRYTSELVRKNFARYIMRPEFVLNFLAVAPSCKQVRETYKNIFPSTLGIELGHRLGDEVFNKILDQVQDWKEKEPGRINAMVSDLSDTLKSDQFKVYEESLETIEEKLLRISNK